MSFVKKDSFVGKFFVGSFCGTFFVGLSLWKVLCGTFFVGRSLWEVLCGKFFVGRGFSRDIKADCSGGFSRWPDLGLLNLQTTQAEACAT
jgi:hypothetical protein